MTDPAEFSLKNVAESVKNLGVLMAAFMATMAFLTAAIWWVIEPRVQPILDRIDSIETIQHDLAILAGRDTSPRLPFISFRHNATVWPEIVRPGDDVEIVYVVQRNRDCPTTVEVRYWSQRSKAFDPRYSETFPAVRAPVTNSPTLWTALITVPNLASGRWAYAPVLVPSGVCSEDPEQSPPPAFFEVVNDRS